MFLIQKNEKSRCWKYSRFLQHTRCSFYCWDKMGNIAYPIHQNPAVTARTYVKPKVVFFMEKKEQEDQNKNTISNLLQPTYSHTFFLTQMLLFPSTTASLHLNTILTTTTLAHMHHHSHTLTLSSTHIYIYVIHGLLVLLSLCFSYDKMIL